MRPLCILLVVAACGEPGMSRQADVERSSSMAEGSCGPSPAPDLRDVVPTRRSAIDIGALAGLALSDDRVLVLDQALPGVIALDTTLQTVLDEFGGFGRGPGELQRITHTKEPPGDYLAVSASAVTIVDPEQMRVNRYSLAGDFRQQVLRETMSIGFSHNEGRIRVRGDTIFFGGGMIPPWRQPATAENPLYTIRWTLGDTAADVFTMPVQRLPLRHGVPMLGFAEASVRWDLYGSCVVLNDGHATELIVFDRATSRLDTIRFELRAVELGVQHDPELYARLGMAGWPAPARVRRFDDLVVDPTGVAWLGIAPPRDRPTESHRVARIALTSRDVRVDTLSFFPKAFGDAGEIYGWQLDSLMLGYVIKAARQDALRY